MLQGPGAPRDAPTDPHPPDHDPLPAGRRRRGDARPGRFLAATIEDLGPALEQFLPCVVGKFVASLDL
jgi:hypothetical protein